MLIPLACLATTMALFAEDAAPPAKPVVDVVFCLDSTGSMGGLIEGAKQKIWSMANGIVSQKPTPQVRIGLVSYRDRGDDYIIRKFDLTDDIDTVFKNLQSFQASGGGDTPESVNQALKEAVGDMSWTKEKDALKIIFLVGDCPPHMDYQDDVKYPETCQAAARASIIINTVQCGRDGSTTPIWKEIARLAEGGYIALEQSGGMAAVSTPFDEDIARISKEIGGTVTAYGSLTVQRAVAAKSVMAASAPASVAADRAYFNLASGGKAVQGRGDLVADVSEGVVKLEEVKEADLPDELKAMTPDERKAHIEKSQKERDVLNGRLAELNRQRADFIEKENQRLAAEGKGDAFDLKVNEMIKEQAGRK
jgi:Mg-chelatase subunit ChlD